jgi:frataxin-like iron-binding protein CyaY
MVISFFIFSKMAQEKFENHDFFSCFFENFEKISSRYKNSQKESIGILTIVGQYVCFQIYEVGELVIIHKRGLNQIWLHVKEESEKKFKNHASFGDMLEPNVI